MKWGGRRGRWRTRLARRAPRPAPPLRSQDFVYLASVTLNAGKVFALFVSSPAKAFKVDEGKLRRIVESFTTI